MSENYALQLRHITKTFPGVKALNDVSFDVRYGTVHSIVGENGAGKSTLMKIIAGSVEPDSGTVTIGQTVKIGYFSQECGNRSCVKRGFCCNT